MNNDYDEHDNYDEHGEGNEELEKDITGHAQDAESALLNMIEDYQMEKLKDPEIWGIVEGFMDRVVKLLSYLEDIHEDNRPNHDSSKLDDLQHQMEENDQNGEDHQHHGHENGEDHHHEHEDDNGDWDYNGHDHGHEHHGYDDNDGYGGHHGC